MYAGNFNRQKIKKATRIAGRWKRAGAAKAPALYPASRGRKFFRSKKFGKRPFSETQEMAF